MRTDSTDAVKNAANREGIQQTPCSRLNYAINITPTVTAFSYSYSLQTETKHVSLKEVDTLS